ncbi:hypothetical protein TL16_g04102 [Triparma laevis f. inornata]|uniref:Protein kinase domain-containing protein n=2 Tax=Triparma laevis TaxID=1534972 RepID=A0A9W7AWE7_9STRA|nr:hypothetical protein TL16_g04102 [Triparma laevis f. inornata]GMH79557.1 hypothetical protein TrLO_g6251 [Triparma laevis f. longispina]
MKETKESDSDHYSSDDDHYSDDFENSPKKSPTKDTSTKDTSTIDTSEAKEKEQDPGPEQKQEEQEETKDFTKEDSLPPSSGDWKEIPFNSIEIEEQIGGGGVGLVHRGYYQDREVAVKTLFDPKVNEALKAEFMNELIQTSRCQHPNVVSVIGACNQPPHLCFVMEICDCSLFDLLHTSHTNSFTPRQRLDMCTQIARGMEYLHYGLKPPLVHRDIKSHNVLVKDEGRTLKICDFGLVGTSTVTAGTPNYMAPELFQSQPFSKAVDVYAYSIMCAEIFTQQLPFRGYDVEDIRKVVVEGERPELLSIDVPDRVMDIIVRGWSGKPEDRPNFHEITEEMEKALEETPEVSALEEMDMLMSGGGGDALDGLM